MPSSSGIDNAVPMWHRLLSGCQRGRRSLSHICRVVFTGAVACGGLLCVVVHVIQLGNRDGRLDSGIAAGDDGVVNFETSAGELRLAARKGLIPHCGLGPRPPANEREKRWAQIPGYNAAMDLAFYSHIHKTSGTSISYFLSEMFPKQSVVPTSHAFRGLNKAQISGKPEPWWDRFQVMFSHNRPNVTAEIEVPESKNVRLLLAVRNPLLHKASIYFESVCRYGLHIKDGVIDQEEATRARMEAPYSAHFSFCRDPQLWVGSRQFNTVYRNFQSTWLSYGGAYRHPCIRPELEKSQWNNAGGGCAAIKERGEDEAIWEEFFERSADAAIRRLEEALWVGVTERMVEASCLLLFTLGKPYHAIGEHRLKQPRPISVWTRESIAKAQRYDKADWRVFEAANDILDLRLWTVKETLKTAGESERERLGHCFEVLTGADDKQADAPGSEERNVERITP